MAAAAAPSPDDLEWEERMATETGPLDMDQAYAGAFPWCKSSRFAAIRTKRAIKAP